jgi:hypothetical protein
MASRSKSALLARLSALSQAPGERQLLIAPEDAAVSGLHRQHAPQIADLGREHRQPHGHRLQHADRHLLGIRGQHEHIQCREHRPRPVDEAEERDALEQPERAGLPLQLGPLRPIACDHQPPAEISRQQGRDSEQPGEVLLRAQAAERAEQALIRMPAKVRRPARLITQGREVDAVRDVVHPARIQAPGFGDHRAQSL